MDERNKKPKLNAKIVGEEIVGEGGHINYRKKIEF